MCCLLCAGVAAGPCTVGSRGPRGAAGRGATATSKNKHPAGGLDLGGFRDPPHPSPQQGFGTPADSLSFPHRVMGATWGVWGLLQQRPEGGGMGLGARGSGVHRDVGGTCALHLSGLGGSRTLRLLTSRAAALPGAGTWAQAEPWRAPSTSSPYLFTPFLTALVVRAPQRATGGFASGAGSWVGCSGAAPSMAQLLEMVLQGW